MRSRREFIQLASISAMLMATKPWNSIAAKQNLKIEDLLEFDTKGQVTITFNRFTWSVKTCLL